MQRYLITVLAVCLNVGVPALADNDEFVTVVETQFRLHDRNYYFSGANFWQAMNMGMADGEGGDRARVRRELDTLHGLGVRNLRIMGASEGPNTEPYRVIPAVQTAPGVYSNAVLEGLDYVLAEMNVREMHAVVVLNNYWHWSGGMAQYVSWAESSAIPYPPSHPDFTGNWWTFMQYSARFYTNELCQTWYRDFMGMLIGRTNTVNGLVYSDDPTIFAWELGNEPRLYPDAWVDETAAYIKSLDSNHMVTVGSEGEAGGNFTHTHDGVNIDYTTCHIWPQNWGWFDPVSTGTYAVAESNALLYLDVHLAAAQLLSKPLVLEEFGMARDYAAPLYDEYDPVASTTFRDTFYAALHERVRSSAAARGAAAGDCFWAWSGESRPAGPTPQWVGDPPHETPGWYSVYDGDATTLDILTGHGVDMRRLTGFTAWVEALHLTGVWWESDWLGTFGDVGRGWIYHVEHGWMYAVGTTSDNIWLWTSDMGWLWTSEGVYPHLYRYSDGTWLWYYKGSSDPRYFFNFVTLTWEAW